MAAIIEARDLTRKFGGLTAVDGLNLSVAAGEIFGLVGPDGAGKTTTLRMLCGLLDPTEGAATVAGYDTVRQGQAVKDQMTTEIRNSWSPRSFTDVKIPSGQFDKTVCNVSYHFHKHGQKYGNIKAYTLAAKKYYEANQGRAKPDGSGILKLPKGTFDKDGKIITFAG